MKKVIFVLILIILEIFALYKINQKRYEKEIEIVEKEVYVNTECAEWQTETISLTIEPDFNPIDKYAKEKLNVRNSINGEVLDVLNVNEKVVQLKELSSGWSLIKYKNNNRFVKSEYLVDKPIEIKVEVEDKQLPQTSQNGVLIGYFKITHYCSCYKCNGSNAGKTASGKPMQVGVTVACNSIKLGTKINIDGRTYEVQDTGGMANNVIDVYVGSHSEAMDKGVRYNVPVYYCQ